MTAKRRATSEFRIGISGWTYPPWRGVFYPKGVAQKNELAYASRQVNSIEINGTFYSLQRPSSFQNWYDATPAGFVFAVKGPQYITHVRRLRDIEEPLANFFASGLLNLKEKLGPILWQFPPRFLFDAEKFDAFFKLLPRDTSAASKLAKLHGERMEGRAMTEADADRPLRYAIEIRHKSFETPEFVALLRKHNVALCFADTAGTWPFAEDLTADFVYARLHGAEELYASGYTSAALEHWAARCGAWASGAEPSDAKHWSDAKPPKAKSRDVYVYFDNDVKVKSPFDAMSLARLLGPAAQGEDRVGKESPPPAKLTKKALASRVRSHWPMQRPPPAKK